MLICAINVQSVISYKTGRNKRSVIVTVYLRCHPIWRRIWFGGLAIFCFPMWLDCLFTSDAIDCLNSQHATKKMSHFPSICKCQSSSSTSELVLLCWSIKNRIQFCDKSTPSMTKHFCVCFISTILWILWTRHVEMNGPWTDPIKKIY